MVKRSSARKLVRSKRAAAGARPSAKGTAQRKGVAKLSQLDLFGASALKPSKERASAAPGELVSRKERAPLREEPHLLDAAPGPGAQEESERPQTPSKIARRESAESMATRQREISVSEFFTKNRHLLGFDNPAKALLTATKEAVDTSLDACEEAGILPAIEVEIEEKAEDRFRLAITDNGPGIVRGQIPKVFGKLLYGSKFHILRQSRGQQGIGISAAGMYAQLTTGQPIRITSRTSKGRPAHFFEIQID